MYSPVKGEIFNRHESLKGEISKHGGSRRIPNWESQNEASEDNQINLVFTSHVEIPNLDFTLKIVDCLLLCSKTFPCYKYFYL